jgi:transcription initiation factor TFIID subunit 2/histone acetyltransferase MYST3
VFVFFSIISFSYQRDVHTISDASQLYKLLCYNHYSDGVVVYELCANVSHVLSSSDGSAHCVIWGNGSQLVLASSSPSSFSTINCLLSHTVTLAVITDIHSITLHRIIFNGCRFDVAVINDSIGVTILFHDLPTHYLSVYPGQLLHVPIKSAENYDVLSVNAVWGNHGYSIKTWWFNNNQYFQVITYNCDYVNLTIHTNDSSTLNSNMTGLVISRQLITTLHHDNRKFRTIAKVKVELKSCPYGFFLNTNQSKGICECTWLFERHIYCNISDETFTRLPFIWAGLIFNGTAWKFAVSPFCHPGFCNYHESHDELIKVNESGSFTRLISETRFTSICHGNRMGPVCSDCLTNYSVVFGSAMCYRCSNLWLFTIIGYALAGPFLVFVLYVVKLTLTSGTLNAVILYAQLSYVAMVIFDLPCNNCDNIYVWITISRLFLSFLNLNLGFPVCFYNGMTEQIKAGLNLIFPVYLLMIVGVVILVSRHSVWLSNKLSYSSVQVLVTVIHLSFTKLLLALINVFTYVKVHIEGDGESESYWINNATLRYGHDTHKNLMITISLISGVFLSSYMIFILFGSFFLKFKKLRSQIRPFYEAIHAPFKDTKQYWFSIRQLLVLVVYLLYTVYRGESVQYLYLSCIPITLFFMTALAYVKPYKFQILNILDLILLGHFCIMATVIWYLFQKNEIRIMILLNSIFTYPVIVMFWVIIAYHILLFTNKLNEVIKFYHFIKNKYFRRLMSKFNDSGSITTTTVTHDRLDGSIFVSVQSREPLLEPY